MPTTYKSAPLTEGERLLRADARSAQKLAEVIGCGHAIVQRWRTGAASPSPRMVERMAAELRIPPEAWQTPKPASAPPPRVSDDGGDVEPRAPLARLDLRSVKTLDTVMAVIADLDKLLENKAVDTADLEKLMGRKLQALRLKNDLEQREALMQAKIVGEHHEWVRVRAALADVVGNCERCAPLLMAALDRLGV